MLEKLNFGRFDAEADTSLYEPGVFVKTRQGKAFELPQHRIIVGRKGSGKTALQKEFERKFNSNYDFFLNIDAENIRFRQLVDTFLSLESKAGGAIELKKAVTNIWEYSILTSCMLLLIGKINSFTQAGATIHNFLRKEGLLKKRIYDLLIDTLENLTQVLCAKQGKAASEIIRAIDNFPLDNVKFRDARNALQEILINSKGILVTFDRIDTYFEVQPKPYSHNLIERYALRTFLSGLVQSVYDISISPLGGKLDFKVFLPKDKYEVIRFRDLDKIKEYIFRINWSPDELREFIARRIAHSLNILDSNGNLCIDMERTWYKIFPQTIKNDSVSQLQENLDEYLIRHTHYKPRDLQYLCSKAKELALTDPSKKNMEITEDIVRRSVREMTKELVDNYFIEFEYEYPFIKRLIGSFRLMPNIMSYDQEFFPRINRFMKQEKTEYSANELVDLLYDTGFMGGLTSKRTDLADFAPTRKVKGKTFSFYFSYIDSTYDVRECESVVVHPIFNEYLHLSINPEIIVVVSQTIWHYKACFSHTICHRLAPRIIISHCYFPN